MAHGQYDAAEALIYDPIAVNRNATREALRSLGFRKLEFASSLDAVRAFLTVRSPDLLLCEVGGAEADTCALVQSIRQGKLGHNPFVVAVLTTWRRDGSIVGQAINSGADDLVARPFSAAKLGERLKAHVERRKDFVVTFNYIGPDRRRDPARAGTQCVTVPNSLQMKTVLRLSAADAEQHIAAAVRDGKRIIDAEKLRRDAVQLYVQWRSLEQRHPVGRDFAAGPSRIRALAAEIGRRAQDAGCALAAEWCETLREMTQTLEASLAAAAGGPPPDLSDTLKEMGEAVLAIGQILAPADVDPARLVELDAKVASIEARPRPAAPQAQSIPATGDRRATAA